MIKLPKTLVALAMTGTIGGSSRKKLYQKLGLEPLYQMQWCWKLCSFYKMWKSQSQNYIYKYIPEAIRSYRTRQGNVVPIIGTKHAFFKNYYFLEWLLDGTS